MTSRGLILVVSAIVLLIAGCGGGGEGGDGDGEGAIDNQLLGLWQANDATRDGSVCSLSTATGWESVTAATIELLYSGECEVKEYHGDVAYTLNGRWTAENQSATMTYGSDTLTFAYLVYWPDKLRMDMTILRDGYEYRVRWVKPVTLTQHDTQLVGTWQASMPSVNGLVHSVWEYFHLQAAGDAYTIQYLDDGTAIAREMDGSVEVTREMGTWATGGGTLTLQIGADPPIRVIVDNGGGLWTFLDEDGNTNTVHWYPIE